LDFLVPVGFIGFWDISLGGGLKIYSSHIYFFKGCLICDWSPLFAQDTLRQRQRCRLFEKPSRSAFWMEGMDRARDRVGGNHGYCLWFFQTI
jgi:hypothetical protein